jgi:hypothetical protein
MLDKKELKQKVLNGSVVGEVVVRKPYVCVEVSYDFNGATIVGYGFSKWNTMDMGMVARASKMVDRLDGNDKDDNYMMASELLGAAKRMLEKLDWSEQRGIEIATGRAKMDVVKQIVELDELKITHKNLGKRLKIHDLQSSSS